MKDGSDFVDTQRMTTIFIGIVRQQDSAVCCDKVRPHPSARLWKVKAVSKVMLARELAV